MNTVGETLAAARALGVERLDARLLLAHHLRTTPSWLLAHDDEAVPGALAHRFEADCRRRAGGEPLAYVIGQWSFRGMVLRVSPAVLVPRPETELLVDWALESLHGELAARAAPVVADLGTGSGAIALAIARECPRATVVACDCSADALAVARENARATALDVEWLQGSWWAALGGRRFDLVLANPPYVAEGDPHLAALAHEPPLALSSGPDGLAALREIIAGAAEHLHPGGWLLLEHGHDQGNAVRTLLSRSGFDAARTRSDLAGLPRCTGGRLA